MERALVCLVNRERAQRGLWRLRSSPRLHRAARDHAGDMVRRRYFSHVSARRGSRTVRQRVARTGYFRRARHRRAAETLAWQRDRHARRIVRTWMRSPTHRGVLLSRRYRDIGVAAVRGNPLGGRGMTVAGVFARRR
jgi:uncharacterized protein YkwD